MDYKALTKWGTHIQHGKSVWVKALYPRGEHQKWFVIVVFECF